MLSSCNLRAFFGELFRIDSEFAQVYQTWEDESWKVFYNYPYILAIELHSARARAVEVLAKYFGLPEDQRSTSWIFRTLNTELGYLGFFRTIRPGGPDHDDLLGVSTDKTLSEYK